MAEAGFATSEPYIYKSELGEGRSYDADLQLIADTGYPMYGQALSVRAADKDALAPCLAKLVPIVQRAQVAYMTDPARTNGVIVAAVQADAGSVWSYSPGLADFAVRRRCASARSSATARTRRWATSRPPGSTA